MCLGMNNKHTQLALLAVSLEESSKGPTRIY